MYNVAYSLYRLSSLNREAFDLNNHCRRGWPNDYDTQIQVQVLKYKASVLLSPTAKCFLLLLSSPFGYLLLARQYVFQASPPLGSHTSLLFLSGGATPMCLGMRSSWASAAPLSHFNILLCLHPTFSSSSQISGKSSFYVYSETFLPDLRFHHGPTPDTLGYHSNPSRFELKFSLFMDRFSWLHTHSHFPYCSHTHSFILVACEHCRTYFLWN